MSKSSKSASEPGFPVKVVPIGDIHEDPDNANEHGKESIAAIEASLKQFGQIEPLVVRKGTGIVIGGNGRLKAMTKLGYENVVVVEFDGTDAEARALAIALNRTGEFSQWNRERLFEQLSEIKTSGLKTPGFTEESLAELAASMNAKNSNTDRFENVKTQPPPKMAWILVGFPIEEFGNYANIVEQLSSNEDLYFDSQVGNVKKD